MICGIRTMTRGTKILRLSIGLPVFNGGKYLGYVLDSILGQTFTDFELIISDNASTDGTEQLCLRYAAMDDRIKYFRNAQNIGASQNWYRVLDLASADYFASVAHDDIYEPDYMRRCIEVLDRDPAAVVCYTKTKTINAAGEVTGVFDVAVDTTSDSPHHRLYHVIHSDYACIQLYGVMRSAALRKTKVFTGYFGCDRNTLAELALLGKLREIQEYLFLHRFYPDALGAALASGKTTEELLMLDPGTNWLRGPTTGTIFHAYFASVRRLVRSRADRIMCYMVLFRLLAEVSNGYVARRLQRIYSRFRLADR